MASGAAVKGTETVLKNITAFGGGFIAHLNDVMRQLEIKLWETVKKNISLEDHTLADLAAMGHPYATTHPANPHTPEYQVHTQSGFMLSGLFSGTSKATISGGTARAEAFCGVDEQLVVHALFVVYGTSKMIPRDFLTGSLDEIRDKAFSLLKTALRDAVINFNGEKVKL